jgi:type I restriction enzyme S subunit
MSNKLPNGWKEYRLGEVIEIFGGGTPRTDVAEYWNGEIAWLSVADFNHGRKYVYDTEKKISKKGFQNSSTKMLKKGDIIISARGTVGAIAVLRKEMAFNQSCYGIRASENITTNDYIYYLIKDAVSEFLQIAHGGVFDTITRDTFSEIDILLPPLPEQRAIASILSSLDDRIDLLHRENKTLEAMAETLFRQWFIEEADEGWEEVKLGDFFPVVTGKKNASFATSDGPYPFFTCSQSVLKAPSYSFNGAAILLAGNGDFNIKHYIGKFEAYQRTYVLMPYDTLYFGFLLTLMKYYLFDITKGYQGSVINFIIKPMIEDFVFLLPKRRDLIEDKLVCFNDLYRKVDANISQIHTLEKLRDILLPKLMSGEVRVKYEEEEMVSCRA